MSLSDLAALGSFVSGFAVLVSLVFLYFQLRQLNMQVLQAETNQRALLNQGVASRTIDGLKWGSEPIMNELNSRMFAGDTKFSAPELRQLRLYLRVRLTGVQDNYVQLRSGLIDQLTFDNVLEGAKGILSQRVFRAVWLDSRLGYAPEWRDYVDRLIAELPLAEPIDAVAQFEASLADVVK
ncbi:MAG TPA: hypothetical protein VN814_12660 [Caulobacteraceae bacterium]|nr:hypothetical protein [Caulobacteraceae bacterium]